MTASGRNGFQVYLLILVVGWSVYTWTTGTDGEVIRALFTQVGLNIWYAGLILSSLVSLGGIALGTYTGLLIERAGMYGLAGMFWWVGMAFLGLATRVDALHLLGVTPLLLAMVAIALQRTQQIKRDLTRMRLGWASSSQSAT